MLVHAPYRSAVSYLFFISSTNVPKARRSIKRAQMSANDIGVSPFDWAHSKCPSRIYAYSPGNPRKTVNGTGVFHKVYMGQGPCAGYTPPV